MDIVLVILGLVLLVIGGEFLVKSSVGLSFKLNIPKIVIGMTVVSFATSAPELLVSLQAALNGSPAIAINNVIGSNIANIGLVLGVTATIGAITVCKGFYRFHWPAMLVFSVLLFFFLKNDNVITFVEGLILVLLLVVFLVILFKFSKNEEVSDDVDDKLAKVTYWKILFWLGIGAVSLYYGAEFLVRGAKNIATHYGVSQAVISVTLIAIGTSIPELAASVISALRGEKAISLGNLIGSNIFNIASVLGITAMIKEIPVTDTQILNRDAFWMLGFVFVLMLLAIVPKRSVICRFKGVLLFLTYVIFIYIAFS